MTMPWWSTSWRSHDSTVFEWVSNFFTYFFTSYLVHHPFVIGRLQEKNNQYKSQKSLVSFFFIQKTSWRSHDEWLHHESMMSKLKVFAFSTQVTKNIKQLYNQQSNPNQIKQLRNHQTTQKSSNNSAIIKQLRHRQILIHSNKLFR